MDFDKLAERICRTNAFLRQNAVKAVNIHLTLRNWLIGFYIVEFEQSGSDRAQYGDRLIAEIARNVQIKGLSETNLKLCRRFYDAYPQILGSLPQEFRNLLPEYFIEDFARHPILGTLSQEFGDDKSVPVIRQTLFDELVEGRSEVAIGQSVTDELQVVENQSNTIGRSVTDEFPNHHLYQLFSFVSFTHLVELIKIDDVDKRRFYELLILKTQPSVRELKRQIETLTYERIGLSEDHKNSFDKVMKKITPQQTADLVKSHYFFEFLNIGQPHLIEENELEQALISHLQQFISELGNGFCFEARQKRMLIGDEYYFIDLVFYHRILKCHVLIDLKTEAAKHGHIGQLKTYLNYYKKNVQESNDGPPVGILLVTHQNKALVEYAVADSDLDIFVSKYQLQLPDKAKLEAFVNNELKNL